MTTPAPTSRPSSDAVDLREALFQRIAMILAFAEEKATSRDIAKQIVAEVLAPILDRLTAAEARAEEAEKHLLQAFTSSWPTDIIDHKATTADRDRLADEVARQAAILAKLTSGCPWDGPPRETEKLTPEMPCPVCGDLGTFDAEASTASRCVSHAQSRKEWRALTATGGNDDPA